MEGACNHDLDAHGGHGERSRPTRADALVRLRALVLTGALEDLEFSLTTGWTDTRSTMAVDLSRVRDLTPRTVAALLWISRCAQARGVTFEVHNPSPSIVERLQSVGLTTAAAVASAGSAPS